MGREFSELQSIQVRFNTRGKYNSPDSTQSNIGELMNDLQKFMGLIEGRFIDREKVIDLVLGRKFHGFVHNLIRKGMNKHKRRVGRSDPGKHRSINMTDYQQIEL